MMWRTASISFHGFHASSNCSIFMTATIFLFFRASTIALVMLSWKPSPGACRSFASTSADPSRRLRRSRASWSTPWAGIRRKSWQRWRKKSRVFWPSRRAWRCCRRAPSPARTTLSCQIGSRHFMTVRPTSSVLMVSEKGRRTLRALLINPRTQAQILCHRTKRRAVTQLKMAIA